MANTTKILLINNGYPTRHRPTYTPYIRNIEVCLQQAGFETQKLVIEYNRKITPLYKIVKYITFWWKCLFKSVRCEYVYINHIPSCWPIAFNPFLLKRKKFIHWHGCDLRRDTKFYKFIKKILRPTIIKSQNIVPSQFFAEELRKYFPDIINDICVSPSGGIDTALFTNRPSPHEEIILGFSGGLIKEKGADTLIYLMEHCEDIENAIGRQIKFHIINFGRQAEYYLQRISQIASCKYKIFSMIEHRDMGDFFNSLDIFLAPYRYEGESLGLALLEAMSCNVPVLCTQKKPFTEFISPLKTGEPVEYSPDLSLFNRNFKSALISLIKNIDSYSPRQLVVEKYSMHHVVRMYEEILK